MGFLHRAEVRPLEVLHESQLELVTIGELADHRRDALEAGQLACPEAALTGDELVAVEGLGHEDRLQDAVLADARGEASSSSWSMRWRGCRGFGRIRSIGISVVAACWLRCGISGGQATTEAALTLGADGHRTPPVATGAGRGRGWLRPAEPWAGAAVGVGDRGVTIATRSSAASAA